MAEATGFLNQLLILLIAAVVVVASFRRIRLSPVLGYIVAGVVIGPHVLHLIPDTEVARSIAEFGIVFLLFAIGLELSFDRLRAMRLMLFGLGGAQIVITAAVVGFALIGLEVEAKTALLVGAGLAMSSTAIVIELLVRRGENTTQFGRAAIGILLMQDLAVVPLLVLVPQLTGDAAILTQAVALAVVKAGSAMVVIVVAGRYALRYLFRWVAQGGSEIVTASALLAILGLASLTSAAGLSLALGAFLAGLLVAETEFRHQVEAEMGPFRGLLLGLFFMTVGLDMDLGLLAREAGLILAASVALIVVKALVLIGLGRLFRLPIEVAVAVGLTLAQAGEFGFVLFALAGDVGVIGAELTQVLLAVIALTMALTPMLADLGRFSANALTAFLRQRAGGNDELAAEAGGLRDHVLIAGFGRVGQTVARLLSAQGIPYIALDLEPMRVREGRAAGLPVFYAHASRLTVLRAAGAERARAAVVTLDRPEESILTVGALRAAQPDLLIYARARDAKDMTRLERAGASLAVPETLESSLQLAAQVLHGAGTSEHDIARLIDRFRAQDYSRLGGLIPMAADKEPAAAADAAAPAPGPDQN